MTVEWHQPSEAPPVPKGKGRLFIVAVRRGHDGKVYTFAAEYLNAMGLMFDDDERPVESDGENEGLSLTTGWYETKEHHSYDTAYYPLELSEGKDELVGWAEVPKWPRLGATKLPPIFRAPLRMKKTKERKDRIHFAADGGFVGACGAGARGWVVTSPNRQTVTCPKCLGTLFRAARGNDS